MYFNTLHRILNKTLIYDRLLYIHISYIRESKTFLLQRSI